MMLRNMLFSIAALLSLVFPAFSGAADAAPRGRAKLLLWEAANPALPGKLYLAGSIHLGKASFYPLDANYDKALAESAEVVLEIFDIDGSAMLEFIKRKAMYHGGKTLSSVAGRENFNAIAAFLREKTGAADPRVLERKRPWFLTLEFAQIFMNESGLSPEFGFETVFRAHVGKRPGRSLETVLSQLSTLEGMDEKTLVEMCMEFVRGEGKDREELKTVLESFRTGDTAPLARHIGELAVKYPVFYRRLLAERNLAMAEKLSGFAKEKKTFFVLVGASHFAGGNSILALLEAKGFSVRQIDASGGKGAIAPVVRR